MNTEISLFHPIPKTMSCAKTGLHKSWRITDFQDAH